MTLEMDWSHSFCLACDRQTEGSVYCSEACRLAEYEVPSTNGSTASSPTSQSNLSWEGSRKKSNPSFMVRLNDHTTLALPHEPDTLSSSSHSSQNHHNLHSMPESSKTSLTSASSHTILHGLQNSHLSIHTDLSALSEDSKKALQSYANLFDQSRYSRRQFRR